MAQIICTYDLFFKFVFGIKSENFLKYRPTIYPILVFRGAARNSRSSGLFEGGTSFLLPLGMFYHAVSPFPHPHAAVLARMLRSAIAIRVPESATINYQSTCIHGACVLHVRAARLDLPRITLVPKRSLRTYTRPTRTSTYFPPRTSTKKSDSRKNNFHKD